MGERARGAPPGYSATQTSGFFEKSLPVDVEFEARVMDILRRRLSGINASVLFEHAQGVAQRRSEGQPSQGALAEAVLQAAPTFMPAAERICLSADLKDLLLSPASIGRPGNEQAVAVHSEADLKTTRSLVRDLCNRHGVESYAAQKALAVSSELARNMVRYAGGGELRVSLNPLRRTMDLVAQDHGPGISQLDAVLRFGQLPGRGVGSGLYGVKRLVDEFHIETGESGTRIKVTLKNL